MGEKTISTGRGGVGNMRASQKIDSQMKSDDSPHSQTKRFTTGRGGKGNMIDNIDPESTRAAQDGGENLEIQRSESAPAPSRTVGRGGYGNNIRNTRSYKQSHSGEDEEGQNICEKITSAFR